MLKRTLFVSAMAGALLVASPASADPKHCPPGHAKKGWCDSDLGFYKDRDARQRDRERLRDAYEQGYRDGQRQAWSVGDRFERDRDDYRILQDYDRYGLVQPPEGYYYAETDGEILLIQAATQLISAFVNGQ